MDSQMLNLFVCALFGFYLCFGLLYFCRRLLTARRRFSLTLFLCLSLFWGGLFWIKRQSHHNEITILLQITTFLAVLFLFEGSFIRKLVVYSVFYLLFICPEILCVSVFIRFHNLLVPDTIYTPLNLLAGCSATEYLGIELSSLLLGLFLLWKISEILQQCIDHLKVTTCLQLLLPLIAPFALNTMIDIQKKTGAVLGLSIIYWLACISSYLLFLRAVRSLKLQHQEYLQKKMELELIKNQMNSASQLSNEYTRLRKWNHDIENHLMSVMYLMDMGNYEEAEGYTASVLSQRDRKENLPEGGDSL